MSALGRAALIRQEDGLIVKSVNSRLLAEDITPVPVEYDVDMIDKIGDMADMYILFLEGDSDEMLELTTFLKDTSKNTGKPLVAIGEKVDCDYIEKLIPDFYFRHFFARPLDMEAFIKRVKKLLGKKDEQQIVKQKKKKNILIVDDDPYFAGVMRDWMKDEYQVTVITEPLRVQRFAVENYLDLIFLDYEMPVTSGPVVLEMLRAEPVTKRIPVVFLTGVDDRRAVEHVLSLHPQGYLLKSTSRDQIRAWLKEFFTEDEEE